jgi:chromosome segregation ATPase
MFLRQNEESQKMSTPDIDTLRDELIAVQSKYDDYRSRAHEVVKQWEKATRQLQNRLTEKEDEHSSMKNAHEVLLRQHEKEIQSLKDESMENRRLLDDALSVIHKHEGETLDCESRAVALTHANDDLTSTVAALSARCIQSDERIRELEAALSSREMDITSIRDISSELEALKVASKKSNQTVQSLSEELKKTSEDFLAALNENKHLRAVAEESTTLKAHLQEMTTVNGALESDIAEHLDTIKTMQRALDETQRTISAMETNQISLTLERDRLIDQVALLEKSTDALESDIVEQGAVTVELHQKCSILSSTADDLRSQLRKRQDEVFDLSTKYTESEASFAEIFAKLEAASQQVLLRTNEVDSQLKEIAALQAHARDLESNKLQLESHCNEMELQLEELESRRDSELEVHGCELFILRCNAKKAQDDLAQIVAHNSTLEADLASAQADRDFYVSELGVARRMQSDLEAMIATKIEQLHQEADIAAQMQGADHDALIAAKQGVHQLTRKLDQSEDDNRSLRAELKEMKESARSNKELMNDLKKKLVESTEANQQLLDQAQGLEKKLENCEFQMKATTLRTSSSVKSLESDIRASRSENERLNLRLQRLRESYEERTEKDKIAVDKYIESQATEREALVDKYNALYEGYKEIKRHSLNCRCGTFGPNESSTKSSEAALMESRQLASETLAKLGIIVDRCRAQEQELSSIRHDNAILHRVLESQLEGSNMVDVDRVLRDRSVTVHQLNIHEGPRRQPRRRNPSTLLGDAQVTDPFDQLTPAAPFQTQNSNLVAPHHGKIARRSGATAFDEHNRPSMSVL